MPDIAPQLEPTRVIETIRLLHLRIEERFPGSGLAGIAVQLRAIAQQARTRSLAMRRPNVALRVGVAALLVVMAAILVYGLVQLRFRDESGWDVLQGVEAAISSVVFLGAGVVFLVTFETRIKRRKVLDALEELRELAHIIDMHQLVKDPDRLLTSHAATASSPKADLTPFLLGRYLDYCSELLSLIGKVGVIYTTDVHDSVVLDAIDSVESLTTGLSRKIWQKMIILDRITSSTTAIATPQPIPSATAEPTATPASAQQTSRDAV